VTIGEGNIPTKLATGLKVKMDLRGLGRYGSNTKDISKRIEREKGDGCLLVLVQIL
jgi:hypothetical protein